MFVHVTRTERVAKAKGVASRLQVYRLESNWASRSNRTSTIIKSFFWLINFSILIGEISDRRKLICLDYNICEYNIYSLYTILLQMLNWKVYNIREYAIYETEETQNDRLVCMTVILYIGPIKSHPTYLQCAATGRSATYIFNTHCHISIGYNKYLRNKERYQWLTEISKIYKRMI